MSERPWKEAVAGRPRAARNPSKAVMWLLAVIGAEGGRGTDEEEGRRKEEGGRMEEEEDADRRTVEEVRREDGDGGGMGKDEGIRGKEERWNRGGGRR